MLLGVYLLVGATLDVRVDTFAHPNLRGCSVQVTTATLPLRIGIPEYLAGTQFVFCDSSSQAHKKTTDKTSSIQFGDWFAGSPISTG